MNPQRSVNSAIARGFVAAYVMCLSGAAVGLAANFNGAAAQLGAAYDPGLAPIGTPAVTVTFSASGVGNSGYHYPPYGYTDFTQPSPQNANAGKVPDHHWVADGVSPGGVGTNFLWRFASLQTNYWMYPGIDHDPVPGEALEATLYGSNNGGSTWIKGTVVKVYEQGWDPATIPDDGVSEWFFGTPVDLITAVPGLTQNQYSFSLGNDYEIDAVMGTPEPASLMLLTAGGLLAIKRRRRLA